MKEEETPQEETCYRVAPWSVEIPTVDLAKLIRSDVSSGAMATYFAMVIWGSEGSFSEDDEFLAGYINRDVKKIAGYMLELESIGVVGRA